MEKTNSKLRLISCGGKNLLVTENQAADFLNDVYADFIDSGEMELFKPESDNWEVLVDILSEADFHVELFIEFTKEEVLA